MKDKFARLKENPRYGKLLHWGKLLSVTGLTQIVIQLAGLVTGLLITNLLPKQEYAFYTIANTMLGTMTVLADSGIGVGVMSIGGKVWQDKHKLGVVLKTGISLRRKFAIFSLMVSLPILGYLLYNQGASAMTITLICLSLLPTFWAALSDSLLETIPKLHQAIVPLQKNQGFVGLGRLVLSAGLIALFPFTFLAIIGSGVPRIIGNIRLKKIAGEYIDENAQVDEAVKKDMLKIVRRTLPSNIYNCASSQVTVWLLSLFGTTTAVANMGALGRISVLLSIFTMMMSVLVTPSYAKLPKVKSKLLFNYVGITAVVIPILLLFIGFCYLMSDYILLLLGSKYGGLNDELVLTLVGNCFYVLTGISYSLFTSRGWVLHPVLNIVVNVLAICVFAYLLDVSDLMGAIIFTISVNMVTFLLNFSYGLFEIFKMKDAKQTELH